MFYGELNLILGIRLFLKTVFQLNSRSILSYTDNYGLIDTKDTKSIKLNLIEQRCVLPDIIRNKESDKTKL